MARFLARRLVFCAALVVIAASAALVLTRLAPGDLTSGLRPFPTTSEIAAERARFGLNRPASAQLLEWLGRAGHLDFGDSFLYGRPVGPLVVAAAGNTAILAIAALLIATVVGIGLGVVTGSGRPGVLPAVVRGGSIAAVSLPPLLTSLFLLFFAARTGWFPVGGMSSEGADGTWAQWLSDLAVHLALPAIALALPVGAAFERFQSSALNEQVHQPFVLAAAARGVRPGALILRHAWPVSLRSVTAIYGLAAGSLLSGSFVVEFVTAWPGLGRLMYQALVARDIYLVAGCAAAGAGLLSIGMLLGDVLHALSDPRVCDAQ